MINRDIISKIELMLKEFPVVCLLGPRQVGKTTIAKSFKVVNKKEAVYLDLEKQSDLKKIEDVELYLLNHRNDFVIIDEVQYRPEIFSCLRPEVDEKRVNGRFLLTGSAAPELVKGVSESLAGRICYLEIYPISLTEALKAKVKLTTHWLRGGFPSALNAKNNEIAERWRENFVKSFAERDLSALFGVMLSSSIVKNFWEMLAGTQGSVWNAANFGRSLGISAPTTNKYLDLLEGAYMVRKLPAWYVNTTKRLVKAPKIYIRDSGILHHFNQITNLKDLPGHIITGASWEGYVIEEICKKLPNYIRPFFYRTHQGAEIDLILVKGLKAIAAIEIKYSLSPSVSKGFYEALDDLGSPMSFVVIPSGMAYKTRQNSKIISLEEFITKDLFKLI
jgi:predicted AAA+ superfamily ATPase